MRSIAVAGKRFRDMEVNNTLHYHSNATSRKNVHRETFSEKFITDSIRNSQRSRSDLALKNHKVLSSHPSPEISIKPPLPLEHLRNSPPADHSAARWQFSSDLVDLEELPKELKHFLKQRDKLYGRRLQLREKRNELRQERSLQIALDAKFIKSVREIPQRSGGMLEEIYTQLDSQRDIIGELQYDYDQAEDEHDAAENQLEKKEENLIKLLQQLTHRDIDDDQSSLSTSWNAGPRRDQSQESNTYDEGQMRFMEYQSRIGDARIMEERLQDLRYEHEVRLSFARKRGDRTLNGDGWDDGCAEQVERTVEELHIIRADIERLKESLQNDGNPNIDSVEKPGQNPAPYETFEIDHDQPAALRKERPASDSVMPNLRKNFGAARSRIVWWIFITFENSPTEHIRHKELLRALGSEFDDKRWAQLVFEYWKEDNDINQQDLSEHDESPIFSRTRKSLLLSSQSKAEDAMTEYEQHFPFLSGAPVDRAIPYPSKTLELDELSEYESRSI